MQEAEESKQAYYRTFEQTSFKSGLIPVTNVAMVTELE